jgi:hypothetical protein
MWLSKRDVGYHVPVQAKCNTKICICAGANGVETSVNWNESLEKDQ